MADIKHNCAICLRDWNHGCLCPVDKGEWMPAAGAVQKEPRAADPVNNPSHYANSTVECIDAIEASMSPEAFKGFLKGNVQKYMWRYEKKIAPAEDLKKARWYLDRLISKVD
ncbi:MAG: hypothetical protein [Caudoviricetes sp.]|nr:MAG: hypothetical protein [Caudoviricetes sp.]